MLDFKITPHMRAARRPGAEVEPSLWKRRAWFADAEGNGAANDSQTDTSADDQASGGDKDGAAAAQDVASLPAWAQAELKKVREEAASNRVKAKAEAEAASKKEVERLAADKKYEELAGKLGKDLDDLKPLAERATVYEAKIKDMVDSRIKVLPAADRALVPDYDDPLKTMEWLDRNAARFARQAAPDMGAGEASGAGGEDKARQLTAEELATAKAFGINPKTMAAQKAAQAARR